MRKWLVLSMLILGVVGASPLTAAQPKMLSNKEFSVELNTQTTPPAPGENAIPLLPGQNNTLNCGSAGQGGGTLCGTQFTIETSAASLGWTLNVESENEFVVFMRFNAAVVLENGGPVSDLVLQSQAGRLSFALSLHQPGNEFPGLQAGRYFFAIAHFEPNEQQYLVSGSTTEPKALALQTPTQLDCSGIEVVCLQQFTVQVETLNRLNLTIRASGEFIAFLRLNRPIELPPVTFDGNGLAQIGIPITDLSVVSQNGRATFTLDQGSSPALQLGTYYVALTNIDNADLSYTLTASLGQPARQPPLASFDFSPAQPRAGQTVNFSDTSSDPEGRITSWSWDFGDGQSSQDQHPAHSYAAPGTYRVRLQASNDARLFATSSQTLTVLPGPPPLSTQPSVIAFDQLAFENSEAWERTIERGCVVYTNVSSQDAVVHLVTPGGREQTLNVAVGNTVLVCGNAAHVLL